MNNHEWNDRRTAQNLIDNARRFRKEECGKPTELENREETEIQQQTHVTGEQ